MSIGARVPMRVYADQRMRWLGSRVAPSLGASCRERHGSSPTTPVHVFDTGALKNWAGRHDSLREGLLLGLLAWAIAGCGGGRGDTTDSLLERTPTQPRPTLSTQLRYDAPQSTVGWGTFDLSARPESNEIDVGLMAGLPVESARWRECQRAELNIDGEHHALEARYFGVPMEDGDYDAVSIDLTIEHVRAMAGATSVTASVCGDRFAIARGQLTKLRAFVRRFDTLASPTRPSRPTPTVAAPPEDLDYVDPGELPT